MTVETMRHRPNCTRPGTTFTRVNAWWIVRCSGCGAVAIRATDESEAKS